MNRKTLALSTLSEFSVRTSVLPALRRGFSEPSRHHVGAVRLLNTAYTAEGRFNFNGEFFKLEDVQLSVPSLQRPRPPLWFATRDPKTLEVLARASRGIPRLLNQVAQLVAQDRVDVNLRGAG